ncbi:MAG: acyl-CoA dehydrogenase family protein [Parvularculales bacterium]
MDFSFSEEQNLLRNMVQSFVRDNYDFDTRRGIIESAEGWRSDYWKQFAELGLLAAPFSQEFGGLGGSSIDVMVIMEEFGSGLVVEPYLETVVLAGGLLQAGAPAGQREGLINSITSGEAVWALAWFEPQGRYNLANVTTTAKKKGDVFVLNGHKAAVVGGPWANHLIVSARTSGGQGDEAGVTLFMVEKNAKGVSVQDYTMVDSKRACDVTFENVKVGTDAVISEVDNGLDLLESVVNAGIGALCAESVGIMKRLNEATLEYSRTRKQFGVPIGSFQVLQHRMVDMFMACEEAVSMTYMVNMKLSDEASAERRRAVSGAKVLIGKAGRAIGQEAIQIHGGMGMTEELNVGHYVRRLTVIDGLFGDVPYHIKRFSATG